MRLRGLGPEFSRSGETVVLTGDAAEARVRTHATALGEKGEGSGEDYDRALACMNFFFLCVFPGIFSPLRLSLSLSQSPTPPGDLCRMHTEEAFWRLVVV